MPVEKPLVLRPSVRAQDPQNQPCRQEAADNKAENGEPRDRSPGPGAQVEGGNEQSHGDNQGGQYNTQDHPICHSIQMSLRLLSDRRIDLELQFTSLNLVHDARRLPGQVGQQIGPRGGATQQRGSPR